MGGRGVLMADKPKGKVISAKTVNAKVDAVLSLLDDIIDSMHLPMHQSDRLKARILKVRDE